jgi:hypothetical protein
MSARGKLALQWQVVMKELLDNANVIGEPAVKRQRLKWFQYNALFYINVALCVSSLLHFVCVICVLLPFRVEYSQSEQLW